jgi:peptidoglycan hydrolase-like protein with peptidoglycan-binding domain
LSVLINKLKAMANLELNSQQVRQIQASLREILGDPIKIDGIYGHQTREAVRKFQTLAKERGVYTGSVDGNLNPETLKLLANETVRSNLALSGNPEGQARQFLRQGATNFTSPAKTKELQQELNRLKAQYGIRTMPALEVDGKYGPKTKQAVAEFQKFLRDNGFASKNQSEFPIDGVWGPKTQAAYERFLAKDNPSRQPNASQRVDVGLSIPDASSILITYSNGNSKIDLPLSPGDKFSVKDAAFCKHQLENAIKTERDEVLRKRLENTKNIFDQILGKYGNKPNQEFVVKVHHSSAARRLIPV